LQCGFVATCTICANDEVYLGKGLCAASCPTGTILDAIGQCVSVADNDGNSPNNTCYPMNIATGNKFFVQRDFNGQGVSPLRLHFFYNSTSSKSIWIASYFQVLIFTNNVVQAKREDGQILTFNVNGGMIVNGQVMSFNTSDAVISAESQREERLVFNGSIYELTLSNNTQESYSSEVQLLSIRYPSGLTHSLSYAANTVTITRKNDSLVLGLTGDNVTSATLSDGSVINYTYDTANGFYRLLTNTYDDNGTCTYLYENTTLLSYITGILNENGNRASSVQYDSEGRAISSEAVPLNSGIERTQIQYNTDGTRTLTNALGKQNIYHFTQFNGEYKMTQVEGQASENCASANQAYT
jgi:hypothetical protein